jgi:two-component system cell cycle response regulator
MSSSRRSSRKRRSSNRGLAVLIARADGIAWINKRWGRAAGDSVLRKLARRLAASLAPEDVFARYDGNRFGMIRWVASADRAAAFAQHLSSHIAGAPFEIPGGRDAAFLTISVGVVFVDPPGEAQLVVAAAEEALRRAKEAGRQPHLLRLTPTSRRCAAPSPSAAAWPRSSPPTGRPSAPRRARVRSRP